VTWLHTTATILFDDYSGWRRGIGERLWQAVVVVVAVVVAPFVETHTKIPCVGGPPPWQDLGLVVVVVVLPPRWWKESSSSHLWKRRKRWLAVVVVVAMKKPAVAVVVAVEALQQ